MDTQHLTFESWMHQVDTECVKLAGVSIYDLPDQAFRDMYESGAFPEEVASDALYDEGFPMDLLY